MANYNYINIKINIKQGNICFTKLENDKSPNDTEYPFDIEDNDNNANNIRVELGIAKVFHKVLNLIKTERDLFQKEDFELLGEMLSKILFGKLNNKSDARNYIMKEMEDTLEISKSSGKRVCRIFLEFDQKSGVAMLPWEYTLYKTRSTGEAASFYIAANIKNRFHIMRRVKENPTPAAVSDRLFIIVMLSLDGNNDANPPIDSRTSTITKIKTSFKKLEIKFNNSLVVEYIESISLKDIKGEVETIYQKWEQQYNTKPCYVLHYVGHAMLENQIGKLVIKNSETGKPDWVEDKKFASLFRTDMLNDAAQPSLVCFQACDSAKIGNYNETLRGVAYEFTKLNIPAVVGMQNEIDALNSTAFFGRFYENILNAKDVCEAVTAGRDYLGREFNIDTEPYVNNSFGSPVLFITTTEPVTLLVDASPEKEELQNEPLQKIFKKETPSDIVNRGSVKTYKFEPGDEAIAVSKKEGENVERLSVNENEIENQVGARIESFDARETMVSNHLNNQTD